MYALRTYKFLHKWRFHYIRWLQVSMCFLEVEAHERLVDSLKAVDTRRSSSSSSSNLYFNTIKI